MVNSLLLFSSSLLLIKTPVFRLRTGEDTQPRSTGDGDGEFRIYQSSF